MAANSSSSATISEKDASLSEDEVDPSLLTSIAKRVQLRNDRKRKVVSTPFTTAPATETDRAPAPPTASEPTPTSPSELAPAPEIAPTPAPPPTTNPEPEHAPVTGLEPAADKAFFL
ncbi:proteoglycan 4-like [Dendrobium catenatum]|uniref:proteoglycan 4-like n=1 Tax=Dendrobium catenatum TaxID=906689 RepID=UPI0009F511E9|nr:proteoglycan 4-like [Dendrobium catenatum]